MELVYFLWALFFIDCVFSRPDLFHESLDDGKELLTNHHHHHDRLISQRNPTKRTTNTTNYTTRHETINARHDITHHSRDTKRHLTSRKYTTRNINKTDRRSQIVRRVKSNNHFLNQPRKSRTLLKDNNYKNDRRFQMLGRTNSSNKKDFLKNFLNTDINNKRSHAVDRVKSKDQEHLVNLYRKQTEFFKDDNDRRSKIFDQPILKNQAKSMDSRQHQQGGNFTKDDNHKKTEVFLLDSSKLGEDGSISAALGGKGGGASAVGNILSPEDFDGGGVTTTGDKKDDIGGNDSLDMANFDGKNPDSLEENVVMNSDTAKGNIFPMFEPSGTAASFKTLDAAALDSNIPAEVDYLKGSFGAAETGGDKKDITAFSSYNNAPENDNGKLFKQEAGLSNSILDDFNVNQLQQQEAIAKDTTAASAAITKELENSDPSKAVDSLLEPIRDGGSASSGTSSFLNMAAAEIKSDPGVSRAVSDDTTLDESTKNAIKEEIDKDVALATGMSGKVDASSITKAKTRSSAFDYKKGSNKNHKKTAPIVGDIANVAEAVDRVALNRADAKSRAKQYYKKQKKFASSSLKSSKDKSQHTVSSSTIKNGKMTKAAQKTTKSASKEDFLDSKKSTQKGNSLDNQNAFEDASPDDAQNSQDEMETNHKNDQQQQQLTTNVDIMNAHPSTLTENEQNLIASIDRAARKKDVASEMAARIIMPMASKNNPFSEQALAPPEQLLDMLSHGKFNDPLSENVLDQLSNLDPNKPLFPAIQQPQRQQSAVSRSPGSLMQVGPELLPVRSVSVNYPKASAVQQQQQANARDIAKTEQLMRSSPYYLAQNNMLLDASHFKSVQDLSNIGESMFPQNVIDLKQPLLLGGGGVDSTGAVKSSIGGGGDGTLGEASTTAEIGENTGISSSQIMSIATSNGAIRAMNSPVDDSSLLNSNNKVTVTGNVRDSLAVVPPHGQEEMAKHGSLAVEGVQDTAHRGNLVSEVTLPQEMTTQHGGLASKMGEHGSLAAEMTLPQTSEQKILHQETHIVKNDIDPLVMDKINNLPSLNMDKVLRAHRHKYNQPATFEGAMAETSVDGNTNDEFVPEKMITLPEEHINRKSCVSV